MSKGFFEKNNTGSKIYKLCEKIFPITRSITGDGVRETLRLLDAYISEGTGLHFDIHEASSGTQVFDWTVPKEWRVRRAFIEDGMGGAYHRHGRK